MEYKLQSFQSLHIHTCPNIHLTCENWGRGRPVDIEKIIIDCVNNFYENIDTTLQQRHKSIFIYNTASMNPIHECPMYFKDLIDVDTDVILLHTKDLVWCQYIYQFSHEFCHFTISSTYDEKNDHFGWLEESICELASLYLLKVASQKWTSSPPYTNWVTYAKEIETYFNSRINLINKIDLGFKTWLSNKLPELSKNRYDRKSNLIIANALLSSILAKPSHWNSLITFAQVEYSSTTTLENFFDIWIESVEDNHKDNLNEIKNIFT